MCNLKNKNSFALLNGYALLSMLFYVFASHLADFIIRFTTDLFHYDFSFRLAISELPKNIGLQCTVLLLLILFTGYFLKKLNAELKKRLSY
ncbi:hypothetical protein SMUG_09060 [Gallibacterium anatis]